MLTATFQQSPRTIYRGVSTSQTQTRLESLPGTCILLQTRPLQTPLAQPHLVKPRRPLVQALNRIPFPPARTLLSVSET